MNTATDGAVVEKAQTDEQIAQAQQEAEDDFAAGFNRVHPEHPQTPDTEADATPDTGAAPAGQDNAAAPEAAAAPVADPWEGVPAVVREKFASLEALPNRLRNIEGHIGGLNNGVKELKAALDTAQAASTTGGSAPSQDAIAYAAGSSAKWDSLKEEYPDWAAGIEERLALSNGKAVDVDALRRDVSGEVRQIVSASVNEAEERAFVRLKHPDWKKVVVSDDFKKWRDAQPDDIKALAASELADDAVAMLDRFKAHVQQSASDAARKQNRLRAAVTPGGRTTGTPTTGLSDEAAFINGFKKAARPIT